jgi:tyrosine-specific transport protein
VNSAVVLSAVPGLADNIASAGAISSTVVNPLEALSTQGGLPALAIDVFSGLAVMTSALGFIEGLNQLWNDSRISLLNEDPAHVAACPEPSYAMSTIPPILLSALLPGSFLSALDIGGLYGVATLFGILPAAMAWRQRYSLDASLATAVTPALPGGRASLAAMIGLPTILITYNTLVMLHVLH